RGPDRRGPPADDAGEGLLHALFAVEGQVARSVSERLGHPVHATGRDGRHRTGLDRRSRSRMRELRSFVIGPSQAARRDGLPVRRWLRAHDVVPGAPSIFAAADLAGHDRPVGPRRRYPHPRGSGRGDVLVESEGLGPYRTQGRRVGRADRRVRVATEGSVRRGLPQARRGSERGDREDPGRPPRGGRSAVSTADWGRLSSDAFNGALFAYIAAMVLSFAYLAFRRTSFHAVATVVGTAGLATNGLSIVARGIAAGRTPWGNMY